MSDQTSPFFKGEWRSLEGDTGTGSKGHYTKPKLSFCLPLMQFAWGVCKRHLSVSKGIN